MSSETESGGWKESLTVWLVALEAAYPLEFDVFGMGKQYSSRAAGRRAETSPRGLADSAALTTSARINTPPETTFLFMITHRSSPDVPKIPDKYLLAKKRDTALWL